MEGTLCLTRSANDQKVLDGLVHAKRALVLSCVGLYAAPAEGRGVFAMPTHDSTEAARGGGSAHLNAGLTMTLSAEDRLTVDHRVLDRTVH